MGMSLVLVLAAGALAGADDRLTGDAAKLQGTWTMVRGETDGKPLPADVAKSARLDIEGDHHTVHVGSDTMVGTHALHPDAKPKGIDSTDTEGPFKGQTIHGIYRLQGDELTICFAGKGMERPKQFTTNTGKSVLLHVWRRERK